MDIVRLHRPHCCYALEHHTLLQPGEKKPMCTLLGSGASPAMTSVWIHTYTSTLCKHCVHILPSLPSPSLPLSPSLPSPLPHTSILFLFPSLSIYLARCHSTQFLEGITQLPCLLDHLVACLCPLLSILQFHASNAGPGVSGMSGVNGVNGVE